MLQELDVPLLVWSVKLLLLALVVIAVAASVYVTRFLCGQALRVAQWLFAYKGDQPSDITAGAGHGARLLVWASVVGLTLWFFIH